MPELRSNFTPGTTPWAVRRAQWRALGIPDADMDKPKIAVVNTSSELSSCFSHLDELAAVVKEGVRAAGGLPFEIRTTAPSDFVTNAGRQARYLLATRDLLVNDIEVVVEGALLDGMVCLSSCDKTTPGHLMAAARLNVPTIVVTGGYQDHGIHRDEPVDIEDVFESVGAVSDGRLSVDELRRMCDVAVCGPGVCAGMGTANTMHVAAEALGMTLPGASLIPARGERVRSLAHAAGERIVGLVEEDLRPRDVMTEGAFANAVRTCLAVCGSVNALRHLQGVATEAENGVDVYALYEKWSRQIPLLTAVRPNGPIRVDELDRAGGTRAVMKGLERWQDPAARTVSGRTAGELLAETAVADPAVVGTVDEPHAPAPTLLLLYGSLAREGGIMKRGAAGGELRFRGPARVFDTQDGAMEAIRDRRIGSGDVVVLRGLGPQGGPGVASASWFVAAIHGAGLGEDIAVVTDGQLSGLNHGVVVGQVCPEAAVGGLIGLVEDGDEITIDTATATVDLLVPDAEVERRRAAWKPPEPTSERGWLAIYQRLVRPLSEGAVIVPRRPGDEPSARPVVPGGS
ncbi:dihydroxy-acid dehydratase [Streptomyces odontomachi]|uniref:dihydroxy-acid dehydratase n=1 Tax=Streptomyces odontomachi TaxID=2944940 RepID=UPI00210A960A|nr:dihydroxy-acid dehydratase [Streptomyces sp. ODS25]